EGTFHQMHGGVATGATEADLAERGRRWTAQYEQIRQRPFTLLRRTPSYIGALPPAALPSIGRSAQQALQEAGRPGEDVAADDRAAPVMDAALLEAHLRLARLRMPGDDYLAWLDRFHQALRPETYLEIGVARGLTLARARPPTRAIGVDPAPIVAHRLQAETHIFPESSDEFFARRRLPGLLGGRPLSLAFIDGLHLFEQALRDFTHVEAHCGPQSVILLHHTVPLDERTQSRTRHTDFHTGDVWKVVPCLKAYRPDLDIFTIETPPAGLTVVTGLD